MATVNIYDMADTWNDGGTTFTAIKMDVTDTASAAGSLLFDLQVGSSSRFAIIKNGDLTLVNTAILGWSGQTNVNVDQPGDTQLHRDAADTLALRRSTNAQTFRVYNTYTDASNYERGVIKFNSNTLEIGSEAAGSGTNRGVRIKSRTTVLVENHLSPAVSTWSLGATNSWNNLFLNNHIIQGGYHQLTEMTAPSAPSTNVVRIYAEDNGSGKTRLMALFATGAAQQIAIEP